MVTQMGGKSKLSRQTLTPNNAENSRLSVSDQPAAQLFARANRFARDETCHCPPRAVRMPRSLSRLAMATMPIGPADRMLRIMGRRLAAKRSASVRRARPSRLAGLRDVRWIAYHRGVSPDRQCKACQAAAGKWNGTNAVFQPASMWCARSACCRTCMWNRQM